MEIIKSIILTITAVTWILKYVQASKENSCNFETAKTWEICGASNVNQSQCLERNCCYAPSSFLESHNISTRCVKLMQREREINGTCVHYTGPVCAPYLEKKILQTQNQTTARLRFVESKFGIEKTDAIFHHFVQALKGITFQNKKCLNITIPALCQYGIPFCKTDNTTEPVCREDCDYIMKDCGRDFNKLFGVIQWIKFDKGIKFDHIKIPNCKVLKYADELQDGETCTHLFGLPNREVRPKISVKEDNHDVTIVIITTSLIILIAVAVVFIWINRRQKKRQDGMLDVPMDTLSIRHRLRQPSANVTSLVDLLERTKPGDVEQYPLDNVEYIKDLGEGQFGRVIHGRVHGVVEGSNITDVAVKCLKEGSNEKIIDSFHQEVALMSILQHPNVLKLLAVSTEEEPYCMIFEFMVNGDLNQFLRRQKDQLNQEQLTNICGDIACGMEYLSFKKILHRDLATRNCLVNGEMRVVIADFGLSRNIYHSEYYRVGGGTLMPIRWMPPEAILYGKFTYAADVFSYGVTMWEVFSYALQPFFGHSNEEVVNFVREGVLLPKPEHCSNFIYGIMLHCWKYNLDDRITFSEILKELGIKNKLEEVSDHKYAELSPEQEIGIDNNPQHYVELSEEHRNDNYTELKLSTQQDNNIDKENYTQLSEHTNNNEYTALECSGKNNIEIIDEQEYIDLSETIEKGNPNKKQDNVQLSKHCTGNDYTDSNPSRERELGITNEALDYIMLSEQPT